MEGTEDFGCGLRRAGGNRLQATGLRQRAGTASVEKAKAQAQAPPQAQDGYILLGTYTATDNEEKLWAVNFKGRCRRRVFPCASMYMYSLGTYVPRMQPGPVILGIYLWVHCTL